MTSLTLRRNTLAVLLCALALPAFGQFNGPGPITTGQLNQPAAVTSDQGLLNPAPRDLQLTHGDLIEIKIFGQPEYAPPVRIGADGNVLLPFIGVISLNHLTITAAEKLIAAKLSAAGMYQEPQVTIQVTDGPNATVTVVGEAHGVLPVIGSRRLLDVIAAAGGIPATASHVITINRSGELQPLVVDLGTNPAQSAFADIPVFPGDTIVVARIGVVYLLGSFKTQGAVPLTTNTPLTLMEATALGGGLAFDAKYSDLRIIRTTGDQRTVLKLNVMDVMHGKVPDPVLQANDILYMPPSFIKASISNGSLNTILSLVSIAFSAFSLSRN